MQLIPPWAVPWYLMNLIVLPYDAVYIMMRPDSVSGSWSNIVFRPLHLYAQYDKVFGDKNDVFVFYIYIIGVFDILASFVIFASLTLDSKGAEKPKLAALAIVQSSELATKTLLYLLHSFYENGKYGRELWLRVAMTIMNGAFVTIPIMLVISITERLQKAMMTKARQV